MSNAQGTRVEKSPTPVAVKVVDIVGGAGKEVLCSHCRCWDFKIIDPFCGWCGTTVLWTREAVNVVLPGNDIQFVGDGPWTSDDVWEAIERANGMTS